MAGYFAGYGGDVDSLSLRLAGLRKITASDQSDSDGSLSLLYTALPQMLQRRLPKIRSLRHVASVYALPKTHSRSASTSSATSIYSESPPPSYHTRPSSSDSSTDAEDSDEETPDLFTSAPSSRPSTSGSATPAARLSVHTKQETDNPPSTNTRSSAHGLALLNLALQSPTPTTDPLNRRLYIDGISYILRGLPDDLSEEETLVLRAATPQTILPPPEQQPNLALQHHHHHPDPQPTPQTPPTLLHRTTSTLTFYTLLLITLAIPHLQTLFATLHAIDARHRFSARFLTQTTLLLRLLAAQALSLAALAWGANDGALRHACRDFGVWVLRDVCGGVDDGVGRAVVGLRLEGDERRGKGVER